MRIAILAITAVLLAACEPITINPGSAAPTPTVTPDAVSQALASGDFRYIESEAQLLDAIDTEIDARTHQFDDALAQLSAGVGPITWDPTHDAAMLSGTFGQHQVLLETNAAFADDKSAQTKTIALAGKSPSRFIALGSNPMRTMARNFESNENLNLWLDNALTWLMAETPDSQRVVIAQMGQNYYFPDQSSTRDWFQTRHSNIALATDCDNELLAACLVEPTDLLVISQVSSLDAQTLANVVEAAMVAGTPVLYMHYDGGMTDAGRALFDVFGIDYQNDNYWHKLGLREQAPTATAQVPAPWQSAKLLVDGLKQNQFQFDVACYASMAPECEQFNDRFAEQFSGAANHLRAALNGYDERNENVFDRDRLLALWVLLGDFYRQEISYPVKESMTASDTPTNTFVQAYLADHLVFNARPYAPVPNDLGNFSRTDFSHVTPVDMTRTYQSKRYMRAAGVYAIPGETVRVTRSDTSDVEVRIQINTQRPGSTKEWDNYRRPEFVRSQPMRIASGQSIEFTSVYGGPIQVLYGSNDLPVTLAFENVGEHPYWASEADNAKFAEQMAAGDYDWAEISTAGFEVHSQLEKMRTTISPYQNAAELAGLVETYTNSYPHALAGFQGPAVAVIDEVHEFVAAKGWQVANIDMVKHMNADQPTCGWGCSGNPYDAGWNFSPVGHGDLHELGHGLERGFFRFEGWGGHSTTNFYSYYSKARFNAETQDATTCQNLPFKEMHERIAFAQTQADPLSYMQANPLNSWSQATATHIQWFMAVQNAGIVENGFHVLPRLHIYERYLWQADNNGEEWAKLAASLGYTTLSLEQYEALSQNDRLIMAMSVVSERDMRAFLAPYGYVMSDLAAQELARLNLEAMPVQYFAMQNGSDYCLSLEQQPISYSDTWPVYEQ
ncbi:ImpA family metalloprotease [Salinibius halmophilus]|uniref:ImpA family metalloprotease n=1 Tax=Salinibius halmophilus TaxID=1853216 RepID=UPI000E666F95|nr:ImpA family metalloprotease [Salinibius halmophilus]